MVEFLNSPDADGREITLIGFSDSVGRFDLNERLSFLRASSLRDALVGTSQGESLAERITVASYGPLAPVACNDTLNGREGNRRVEIWLR
jgi:phosphate transport system substrate-binding protein